jgi:hypothetical protein
MLISNWKQTNKKKERKKDKESSSSSAEEKKKKKDGFSFEVDGNKDIKNSWADKLKFSGEFNVTFLMLMKA